jgi:hypothetical protein
MKLTKNSLVKALIGDLEEIGYCYIKDSLTGADGLFIKKIKNDFFLSLGLIISRYHNSTFTGSFYLSKSTRWSSLWDDIPGESYVRIAKFLTKKERQFYLEDDYKKEGIVDAWWNWENSAVSNQFIEVVKIAEDRFLGQQNLFIDIDKSKEVSKFKKLSSEVTKLVERGIDDTMEYRFVPNKSIDNIPVDWFKAAESILIANDEILNGNTVKLLGADAWRQQYILNKS